MSQGSLFVAFSSISLARMLHNEQDCFAMAAFSRLHRAGVLTEHVLMSPWLPALLPPPLLLVKDANRTHTRTSFPADHLAPLAAADLCCLPSLAGPQCSLQATPSFRMGSATTSQCDCMRAMPCCCWCCCSSFVVCCAKLLFLPLVIVWQLFEELRDKLQSKYHELQLNKQQQVSTCY